MSRVTLSTFRCDVTPPLGHPLCAGWSGRAKAISDRLYALGVVLRDGDEPPVVLCAIDWAEISNASHLMICRRLAEAVRTGVDRVALHCVHVHCAPWPDEQAQSILAAHPEVPQVMDASWIEEVADRLAAAVAEAAARPTPVSHVGVSQSAVHRVASNRRILGPGGRVDAVRWTKTVDPAVRAMPKGLIDPVLRTVSFWNQDRELASMHYYAVHPTSYDDDETVTADFVGIARQRLQQEDAGTASTRSR